MLKKYNQKLIPLAKALRHNQTREERILWYEFLSKYPVKFTRQKVIGHYIADFYCPKIKLVIEIDGHSHYVNNKAIQYDKDRTDFIEKFGITVIRFYNGEITANFEAVCYDINQIVTECLNRTE